MENKYTSKEFNCFYKSQPGLFKISQHYFEFRSSIKVEFKLPIKTIKKIINHEFKNDHYKIEIIAEFKSLTKSFNLLTLNREYYNSISSEYNKILNSFNSFFKKLITNRSKDFPHLLFIFEEIVLKANLISEKDFILLYPKIYFQLTMNYFLYKTNKRKSFLTIYENSLEKKFSTNEISEKDKKFSNNEREKKIKKSNEENELNSLEKFINFLINEEENFFIYNIIKENIFKEINSFYNNNEINNNKNKNEMKKEKILIYFNKIKNSIEKYKEKYNLKNIENLYCNSLMKGKSKFQFLNSLKNLNNSEKENFLLFNSFKKISSFNETNISKEGEKFSLLLYKLFILENDWKTSLYKFENNFHFNNLKKLYEIENNNNNNNNNNIKRKCFYKKRSFGNFRSEKNNFIFKNSFSINNEKEKKNFIIDDINKESFLISSFFVSKIRKKLILKEKENKSENKNFILLRFCDDLINRIKFKNLVSLKESEKIIEQIESFKNSLFSFNLNK